MKTSYLLAMQFFLFFNLTHAQEKKIKIDVSGNILKKSTIISPNKYEIIMTSIEADKNYEVEITKEDVIYDSFILPDGFTEFSGKEVSFLNEKIIDIIKINREEKVSIKIDVFKSKVTKKDTSIVKEKSYIYKFETERRGRWQTTFGFNFIYLIKNDTYFSKTTTDSTFTITEGRNQNKYDFHPTLMFTWFPTQNKKKIRDFNFGFSGGLGYDLEKSLSVFTGFSAIYNQNITFTAGIAFHNQERLSSNYNEGNIIKENLTFDQLHTDYIRANPFVSVSFRLDKSPFKN